MRFLRIYPYAYYFCQKRDNGKRCCKCTSLDYAFRFNTRKCDHCGYVCVLVKPSAQGFMFAWLGFLPCSCISSAVFWSLRPVLS